MGKRTKIILAVGAILLVLSILAILSINRQSQTKPLQRTGDINTSPNLQPAQDADVAATITYNGASFIPSVTAIDAHSTVRVRNRSLRVLKFVSDPFSTQDDEPELNIGTLNPGESKTFYISQKGHWGFHNALDPSEMGTILVQ